ncbi:MAG: hypothetical protein KAH06_06385 [Desulfobacterales bacterium]|jgi:hypothetical protein|nr:hypothetical protein [Desulfobacterales bacterium]
MNTITIIVALLTLWLVMGLGYLAEYFKLRKQGQSLPETLKSIEGILFIASIFIPPIVIILYR